MTVKQSQGQQTYHENVDPDQGYNHAKFERSHLNSVQEKDKVTVSLVFFQSRNICPLNMCPKKIK